MLSCTACAVDLRSGKRDALYIGVVRIKSSAIASGGREKASVFGAWVNSAETGISSVGLGYREQSILLIPKECRVVIFVNSKIELDKITAALGPTVNGKEKPCALPAK